MRTTTPAAHHALDVAVAQEVERPTCGIPNYVGCQASVKGFNAALILKDLANDWD